MRSFRLLLAGLCAAMLLPAQNVSSTVKGTVHDQSGAAIPNAQCVLTNGATGLKTTVATGNDGGFVFLDVQAGTYRLRVQAAHDTEIAREKLADEVEKIQPWRSAAA